MLNRKHSNGAWTGFFGYAEKDITPPIDIYFRNWGAAAFDHAIGVHKPLLMQCLVFGDELHDQRIIITADLGWWKNNEDELKIRNTLLKYFGLRVDQLIFCLSHTHAGPSICSTEWNMPGGDLIIDYLQTLLNSAITCIEEAKRKQLEVVIQWTSGVCALAKQRDLKFENNFLIGFNPEGDPDQTLIVGEVRTILGELYLVICNYACHPTSFAHENQLISPDYVAATRELILKEKKVPLVFLQGASGELAPKKQYLSNPDLVDANGRELGYAILSIMETSDRFNTEWRLKGSLSSGAPLAIWEEIQIIPSKNLFGKDVKVKVPYKNQENIDDIIKQIDNSENRVLVDRLRRKLNTRRSIGDKKEGQIPVWIWNIGEAIIVAQPNEAYSLYQTAVRAAFPERIIIFINVANGYIGYLPPADTYQNDMYAVWQTPYGEGSLELLIKETINQIQTFHN